MTGADNDAALRALADTQHYTLMIDPDDSAYMELDPDGRYVLAEDVESLLERLSAAEAAPLSGLPLCRCGHPDEAHGNADPECGISGCRCLAYVQGDGLPASIKTVDCGVEECGWRGVEHRHRVEAAPLDVESGWQLAHGLAIDVLTAAVPDGVREHAETVETLFWDRDRARAYAAEPEPEEGT
jgi:hypothetical protein